MTKSVMTVMRSLLIVFCLTTFVQPLMARTLRAMTFNIRLGSADDGINSWKYRCDDVRSFIKTMKPDVFGVQEAVPEQMKFLSDTLKDYAHVGVGREDGKDGGEHMAVFYRKDLYKLVNSGKITRNAGKKVLSAVIESGVDPEEYCRENSIGTQSDEGLILSVVAKAIETNPNAVADFKGGKTKAFQALFGACMRELKGNGDPAVIRELLEKELQKI